MTLAVIDIAILILYMVGIVSLGIYLRRRASGSVEDYFLAGRRVHWLWISMSGSVTTFDITGTLWIVAMFYEMGLKGMWIHWTWGFLMPAAFFAFTGKWVRRSNVVTGAQWLETRFGTGLDARIARLMYAVMSIIFTVGMIGYAFQGIGKFVSVYFPISEHAGALLIIGVTSIYVILGGMYSVIFTDVVQTLILTVAAFWVTYIGFHEITYEGLAAAAPRGWLEIWPSWEPAHLAGSENFQFFGALCIAWVLKGLFLNAGGPGQLTDFQRFLSTRSARDASKVGAGWCFFLISRWGMCMAITVLAMIGIEGVTDHEKVLPLVLNDYLPMGIKGLVLAGFLAAFMSTFDSTINTGASYVVQDIYRAHIKSNAGSKELTWAGYIASLLIVGSGLLVGFQAKSVQSIWNWLMMVFGAGFCVPNALRWYWRRFNAWGTVISLGAGMALCFGLTAFYPDARTDIAFYVIVGGSLIAGIATALLTAPTDKTVLQNFYNHVRPGGFWGPERASAKNDPSAIPEESFAYDLLNAFIGMIVVICIYLTPIYAVIHRLDVVKWLSLAISVCLVILWRTWYCRLPND